MRNARDGALILLAAGRSTRFGSDDKLASDLRGEALVEHCIRTFTSFDFGQRIAVVRDPSSIAADLLARADYQLIVNPSPEQGMGTSLALGAAAIGAHAYCLICLGDMPSVPASHIRAVLEAEGDVVASSANGIDQPPVLFEATHFPTLVRQSGDHGPRDLIRGARKVTALAAHLADIDRPGDLDLLRRPT